MYRTLDKLQFAIRNEYCCQDDVASKNVSEVDQELGGGELSLSSCPGVGNGLLRTKKISNPQWYAQGGW